MTFYVDDDEDRNLSPAMRKWRRSVRKYGVKPGSGLSTARNTSQVATPHTPLNFYVDDAEEIWSPSMKRWRRSARPTFVEGGGPTVSTAVRIIDNDADLYDSIRIIDSVPGGYPLSEQRVVD